MDMADMDIKITTEDMITIKPTNTHKNLTNIPKCRIKNRNIPTKSLKYQIRSHSTPIKVDDIILTPTSMAATMTTIIMDTGTTTVTTTVTITIIMTMDMAVTITVT